jgi:hypothetical protein
MREEVQQSPREIKHDVEMIDRQREWSVGSIDLSLHFAGERGHDGGA